MELVTPSKKQITSLRTALGLEDTQESDPSLSDRALIEQLIERSSWDIVVQNPSTNNVIWAMKVNPQQKQSLPLR